MLQNYFSQIFDWLWLLGVTQCFNVIFLKLGLTLVCFVMTVSKCVWKAGLFHLHPFSLLIIKDKRWYIIIQVKFIKVFFSKLHVSPYILYTRLSIHISSVIWQKNPMYLYLLKFYFLIINKHKFGNRNGSWFNNYAWHVNIFLKFLGCMKDLANKMLK